MAKNTGSTGSLQKIFVCDIGKYLCPPFPLCWNMPPLALGKTLCPAKRPFFEKPQPPLYLGGGRTLCVIRLILTFQTRQMSTVSHMNKVVENDNEMDDQ